MLKQDTNKMEKEIICDRCHKPVSGLNKTYRVMYEGPAIDEYEQILSEYISEAHPGEIWEDNINELEAKYGHEKVDKAFFYDQLSSTVGSSWECINCIDK